MAASTNSLRLVNVLSDIDPFTVTKVKRGSITTIKRGDTESNILASFYYFLVNERENKKKEEKNTAIVEKQIAMNATDVASSAPTATAIKEQKDSSGFGILSMLGIVSVGAGLFVFSDEIQQKINEIKQNFDETKWDGVLEQIKKLFDIDLGNIISGTGVGADLSLSKEAIDPKEVYKYLTETKGIDPTHAMGMMANIMGESGFRPGAFVTDEKGLPTGGLFQHHDPEKGKGRFTEMTKFVGPDWQKDWKKQVDFALSEPETKQYLATPYTTNPAATAGFTHVFEKPLHESEDIQKRIGFLPGIERKITETPQMESGKLYSPAPRESMNRIVGHVGEHRPGHEHKGVDYAMPEGTQISAANSGTVKTGFQKDGAGQYVTITGDDGTVTKYMHLKQISVSDGQRVSAGQMIGLSGGKAGADYSGSSEGPHLHFEYWKNGKIQDPEKISYATPSGPELQGIPTRETLPTTSQPQQILVSQVQANQSQTIVKKGTSQGPGDAAPGRSTSRDFVRER